MKREEFEIMAPVGSRESLAAALQAGADSIYFGIERLNMRAHSASAFTIDDLKDIAATCREKGVRSYLTVNTIIYGEDLPLMRQILDAAKAAEISAVIASDVAVMTYARRIGLEVHLSTQLNISNVEALRFYAQFADVVVLARELNIRQVRAIYDAIQQDRICGPKGELIRIEMFCHGALCMAVSGKCYLSLMNAGRSANRGECMQLCRRSYLVRDKETETELEVDGPYIMSPKDLKTIRFLDKLVDAGVRVFKIEGRARGPEYVRTVVECYREAIDLKLEIEHGEAGAETTAEAGKPDFGHPAFAGRLDAWDERLKTVFNRGFWDGYYQGQRLGEWSQTYGSQTTERKVYVGRGTKYYSRLGLGEFHIEATELHVGDKFLVTGPTTGAIYGIIEEMHDDTNLPVEVARQGANVSFRVETKIRPSDKLFRIDKV
ncbi:MAG: U32 family peptidase [Bacteroidaceae bacterium]|nr:U32 family peptidase [Bacteroidaceae bacterium]